MKQEEELKLKEEQDEKLLFKAQEEIEKEIIEWLKEEYKRLLDGEI